MTSMSRLCMVLRVDACAEIRAQVVILVRVLPQIVERHAPWRGRKYVLIPIRSNHQCARSALANA